jgi:phage terminase large subunit
MVTAIHRQAPPAAAPQNQNPFTAIVLAFRADRVGFVKKILGVETIEKWQEKELRALDEGCTRLSIRSGHGVGKTTFLAWVSIHFLLTRYPAKVAVTAPSAPQLYDGLAAEVKLWLKKAEANHPVLAGVLDTNSERVFMRAAPEAVFLTYRTSRKENPEALQGIHAEHVLLIADEASGVAEAVFEAAAGSMSTKGAITILTGNPTRANGFFYQTHTNPKLAAVWRRVRVSCRESSRVDPAYIEEERAYGENSNRFRIRVLGEFPAGDDDTLIPRAHLDAAKIRKIDPHAINEPTYWGLDVARYGSDSSGLAKRKGSVWLEPVKRWSGISLMELVGKIVAEWNDTPQFARPEAIFVDVIGLGAGVVDRLQELELPAVGINVSELPSVMSQAVRLRDELWCHARDWFASLNCCAPDDKQTMDELAAATVSYTSAGKTKVASKDEMRALGLGSPDGADAFNLTFARQGAMAAGSMRGRSKKGPLRRSNTRRV